MAFHSREYLDIVKDIMDAYKTHADEVKKKETRRAIHLSIGKWIAENIVALGALVVAIIALVRTF